MGNHSEIFSSHMFTFLIGENKKPIVVHAAAIAKQSKALNTLINGSMVEARVRSASLIDVSEEDFLKFCEFAYTGDYSIPSCTIHPETNLSSRADEDNPTPETTVGSLPAAPAVIESLPEDPWSFGMRKKVKKPSKTTLLRNSFDNQSYCPVLPRQPFLDSCQIVTNSKRTEDYTPVFLAHAHLYVLADKYGVESLKRLSLHKLHKTLVDFTLYEERIEDIAELVRFSYCNDHTADQGRDELRVLVLEFVASRHDFIGESEPFLSLVEEGGSFARDFWVFVRKNLIWDHV